MVLPLWPHAEYCPDSVVAFDGATTLDRIESDYILSSLAQLYGIRSLFTKAHLHCLALLEVLSHKVISLHLHVQLLIAKFVLCAKTIHYN